MFERKLRQKNLLAGFLFPYYRNIWYFTRKILASNCHVVFLLTFRNTLKSMKNEF